MKKQKCRVCGCTNERACKGGCRWVMFDLCSACYTPVQKETPRASDNMKEQFKNHFKSLSSESWEIEFEKQFELEMQGCSECGGSIFKYKGQDQYDLNWIKYFIKNTITAEVERGRKEVVEEVESLLKAFSVKAPAESYSGTFKTEQFINVLKQKLNENTN